MPKCTITLSKELIDFYRILAKRDNRTAEEQMGEALAIYAEMLSTCLRPQKLGPDTPFFS